MRMSLAQPNRAQKLEKISTPSSSFRAMDFMLVCYNEESHWDELPESQRNQIVDECVAYSHELRRSGHLISSGRLQATSTASTLREAKGRTVVMDGPFAETKEMLAGYYLVKCKDREEALAIAARNPKLKYGHGSIEVRAMIPE